MTDIGTFISDIFSPLGILGGLICIFLLFYIDAIFFPTIPELFTVLIFTSNDYGISTLAFGTLILMSIALAEVLGLLTLYVVIKRAKVPGRVEGVVRKYQTFLICPDERMILVNRIAPILPFLGAFVAIFKWGLKRSIGYTLVGGMIKYGLILALSGVFITYMERGTAMLATIVMVAIVIAVSFMASWLRKNRMEGGNEDSPT